jgi:hypothetical protein
VWFVCHNGFHVRDNTWILPPYLFWVVFAVILNLTNGRPGKGVDSSAPHFVYLRVRMLRAYAVARQAA